MANAISLAEIGIRQLPPEASAAQLQTATAPVEPFDAVVSRLIPALAAVIEHDDCPKEVAYSVSETECALMNEGFMEPFEAEA